eukprot:354782-Chlamydomonas_euryale.AAC.11
MDGTAGRDAPAADAQRGSSGPRHLPVARARPTDARDRGAVLQGAHGGWVPRAAHHVGVGGKGVGVCECGRGRGGAGQSHEIVAQCAPCGRGTAAGFDELHVGVWGGGRGPDVQQGREALACDECLALRCVAWVWTAAAVAKFVCHTICSPARHAASPVTQPHNPPPLALWPAVSHACAGRAAPARRAHGGGDAWAAEGPAAQEAHEPGHLQVGRYRETEGEEGLAEAGGGTHGRSVT